MIKPGIPEDESSRLEDLRSLNILDTPPEDRFDRLARMAKRMFGVPIALVSFVDEERQWFKSCLGLTVKETPRDISFCGHAILGSEVFIIPDALLDDRFMDNPLVLNDPSIRFYAGCPLTLPSGSKIGTLCIKDVKPRQLNTDDIELLRDLALMVENEISALEIATTDELTKISNRRGFLTLAQKSLEYCKRNRVDACLVYFDLNHFKQINDNFGHLEGDKVLTTFSDLMLNNLRNSDIFARLGGDEFVALLMNTPKEGAQTAIAKLQDRLDYHNKEANCGYEIEFSYGIAEYDPKKHDNIDDLLADSDSLMYECKKKNK